MLDLGLTEPQFWNSTPREIYAFYRAQAAKEGRWRFYMATSMGAKHQSGRALTVQDFMPAEVQTPKTTIEDQIAATRAFMKAFERAGQVVN